MNDPKNEVHVPDWVVRLIVAGASAAGLGLIGWGANSVRLSNDELRLNTQATDIRANTTELSTHQTQLAVIEQEYSEINHRLDAIASKLDVAGDPPPIGTSNGGGAR